MEGKFFVEMKVVFITGTSLGRVWNSGTDLVIVEGGGGGHNTRKHM